jgi:ribonuclease E
MADLPIAEEPAIAEAELTEEKGKTRRRPRARKGAPGAVEEAASVQDVAAEAQPEPSAEEKPKRKSRARKKAEEPAPVEAAKPARDKAAAATPMPEPSNEDAPSGPRRGWWQRTFG